MKALLTTLLLTSLMLGQAKDDVRIYACHCDERMVNSLGIRWTTHDLKSSQDKCQWGIEGRIGPPATTEWRPIPTNIPKWHSEYRWSCGEVLPKGQYCRPKKFSPDICSTQDKP